MAEWTTFSRWLLQVLIAVIANPLREIGPGKKFLWTNTITIYLHVCNMSSAEDSLDLLRWRNLYQIWKIVTVPFSELHLYYRFKFYAASVARKSYAYICLLGKIEWICQNIKFQKDGFYLRSRICWRRLISTISEDNFVPTYILTCIIFILILCIVWRSLCEWIYIFECS
jgi:hypothetical protein